MSEAEEGKVYIETRTSVDTYRYPFFLNTDDKCRTFCNKFHVLVSLVKFKSFEMKVILDSHKSFVDLPFTFGNFNYG